MVLCWQQKESALAVLRMGTPLPEGHCPCLRPQNKENPEEADKVGKALQVQVLLY